MNQHCHRRQAAQPNLSSERTACGLLRMPAVATHGARPSSKISPRRTCVYRFRRAAVYVDKILKGAKPGALAVEQSAKFEFVLNSKTAQQLGLALPPTFLLRVDEVLQ